MCVCHIRAQIRSLQYFGQEFIHMDIYVCVCWYIDLKVKLSLPVSVCAIRAVSISALCTLHKSFINPRPTESGLCARNHKSTQQTFAVAVRSKNDTRRNEKWHAKCTESKQKCQVLHSEPLYKTDFVLYLCLPEALWWKKLKTKPMIGMNTPNGVYLSCTLQKQCCWQACGRAPSSLHSSSLQFGR